MPNVGRDVEVSELSLNSALRASYAMLIPSKGATKGRDQPRGSGSRG